MGSRLETKLFGNAEHFRNADRRVPELVSELSRIDPDAVKPQQDHESRQAWIRCNFLVWVPDH